ncbi:uncharacterized protein LOC128672597 [Plodia interpunctella]|uniref:uncharacterized protein LOC128672597 n=1 Tax=Plodia interpunctella TaxID=58824 RepID=UPI002367A392|nr:uncharacterized protein LOC128672597 [Plodia interpunctella]
MMKIVKVLLLLSVARNVTPRKHTKVSSDESIENLLYYQDCKHSTAPPSSSPIPLKMKEELPKPTCPFPKMCCAMSCNNEPCVAEQLNAYGNQIHSNIEPMSRVQNRFGANQPFLRARKKKLRPPLPLGQPPNGRRDFGFTKENIKSLISQDGDIRKILKDLVRVTMQKVDLQEMIKNRRNDMLTSTTTTTGNPEDSEYMTDDL